MWTFLAILKWIGILLGAILGLLLVLLVSAVFVPVRYEVRGSTQDKPVYSFRFSWLLSLVSVKKKQNSDRIRLYVFGIPIRCLAGGGKQASSPAEDKTTGHKEPQADRTEKHEKEPSPPADSGKSETARSRREKRRQGKKNRTQKKKNFSFNRVSSIMGLVKENRKLLRRLFGEIKDLIRYLAPKKIRGEMILGTGDPSATGLLLEDLVCFLWSIRKGCRSRRILRRNDFRPKELSKEGSACFIF